MENLFIIFINSFLGKDNIFLTMITRVIFFIFASYVFFSCNNSRNDKNGLDYKPKQELISPENEELLICLGEEEKFNGNWHVLIIAGNELDTLVAYSISKLNEQFQINGYSLLFRQGKYDLKRFPDSCILKTSPVYEKIYFNPLGRIMVSGNKLKILKDKNIIKHDKIPSKFDSFVISFYEYNGTKIINNGFTYEGENDSLEVLFRTISALINN